MRLADNQEQNRRVVFYNSRQCLQGSLDTLARAQQAKGRKYTTSGNPVLFFQLFFVFMCHQMSSMRNDIQFFPLDTVFLFKNLCRRPGHNDHRGTVLAQLPEILFLFQRRMGQHRVKNNNNSFRQQTRKRQELILVFAEQAELMLDKHQFYFRVFIHLPRYPRELISLRRIQHILNLIVINILLASRFQSTHLHGKRIPELHLDCANQIVRESGYATFPGRISRHAYYFFHFL